MSKTKERIASDGFMSKYKTVSKVLEAAYEGAVLKVKREIYQEVLFIQKSILIIGDGKELGEIIIETSYADCIEAEDTLFHLYSLTTRQSGDENFVLLITNSQFVISKCTFTTSQGGAVDISKCSDFP